jgi:hypothetical protein
MTPTKISQLDVDEVVVSAVGALIRPLRGAIKLTIPQAMTFRAVYLFLEAIPTVPGEDFELEAEIEFRRSGCGIYSIPASIAENANNAGIVQKSRLTAFLNVGVGTAESLFAELSAPLTNGQMSTTLTPQKLSGDFDEVWLNILGSRNTGSSFSGWRALLAVRSSEGES